MRHRSPRLTFILMGLLAVVSCNPEDASTQSLSHRNWLLAEARWESHSLAVELPSDSIDNLAIDPEGHLWVATQFGAYRFDGAAWETVVPYPIPVRDFAFDSEGRAWISTGAGLQLYEQGELEIHLDSNQDLVDAHVQSVLIDSLDRLWIGNLLGGHAHPTGFTVAMLEDDHWTYYGTDFEEGELSTIETVFDLAEDLTGNIWIAGSEELASFDGTAWELVAFPEQPASMEALCVAIDSTNRVWFGTKSSGLWILDDEEWSQYSSETGLPSNTVWDIEFDNADRAWVATGEGLVVIDGDNWITYTTNDGLLHNEVRALALTDSCVWVGTWRGLSRLTFVNDR